MWELPGPDRFLEKAVEHLDEGRHLLLVLPEPLAAEDPLLRLRRKLKDRGMGHVEFMPSPAPGRDPFDAVAEVLGCPRDAVATLRELFDYDHPPAQTLALNLTKLDTTDLASWAELLQAGGSVAQTHRGRSPFQLLAVLRPGLHLPAEDLYLVHHPWWCVLTAPDVDWMVDRALENFPPAGTAGHYWVRSLCRAFGGTTAT